ASVAATAHELLRAPERDQSATAAAALRDPVGWAAWPRMDGARRAERQPEAVPLRELLRQRVEARRVLPRVSPPRSAGPDAARRRAVRLRGPVLAHGRRSLRPDVPLRG